MGALPRWEGLASYAETPGLLPGSCLDRREDRRRCLQSGVGDTNQADPSFRAACGCSSAARRPPMPSERRNRLRRLRSRSERRASAEPQSIAGNKLPKQPLPGFRPAVSRPTWSRSELPKANSICWWPRSAPARSPWRGYIVPPPFKPPLTSSEGLPMNRALAISTAGWKGALLKLGVSIIRLALTLGE